MGLHREAEKSKICRVGQQAANPEKSGCCSSSPKSVHFQSSLLFMGGPSFSIKAFNWLGEAHSQDRGQFAFLNLNVKVI